MIRIQNKVKKVSCNTKKLQHDAQRILDFLGYPDFDLGILLTTNKTIHGYNREFRHKDKPTDILSFAYHTDLKAGQKIKVQSADDKALGDLIISLEYVHKDAPNHGQTFEQRMQLLLVHGICHLLGYDHETDADYKVMHELEAKILDMLANKD